jgi:hypothetical protein
VQYGASFGAPLIKNRTFFFGNFGQTRRNDSNVITIAPANVSAINNRFGMHIIRSRNVNVPVNLENRFTRQALGDFQLSYIFTYASRLPFNVLAGSDLNGDTNNNGRPRGQGSNTGRGFDFASFDLLFRAGST